MARASCGEAMNDRQTVLMFWLVGALVLCALAFLATCATPKAAQGQPCLTEPPPQQAPFYPTQGGTQGCPAVFMWCLSPESGVKLARNMSAYRAWTERAWEKCGR